MLPRYCADVYASAELERDFVRCVSYHKEVEAVFLETTWETARLAINPLCIADAQCFWGVGKQILCA